MTEPAVKETAMVDVGELRRLEAEATPAPWVATTIGHADQHDAATAAFEAVMARRDPDIPDMQWSDLSWVDVPAGHAALTGNGPRAVENAALIATVRTQLPAILDRLERLEKVAEKARRIAAVGALAPQRLWVDLEAALAQLDKET